MGALSKQWQNARGQLTRGVAAFCLGLAEVVAADKSALERQLIRRQGTSSPIEGEWGFWTPPSCVGLHISLGKHADSLNVGKRVRFQIKKKILHFQTRKLGEPS